MNKIRKTGSIALAAALIASSAPIQVFAEASLHPVSQVTSYSSQEIDKAQIEEIKIFVNGEEVNVDKPAIVSGEERVRPSIKVRLQGSQEWIDYPVSEFYTNSSRIINDFATGGLYLPGDYEEGVVEFELKGRGSMTASFKIVREADIPIEDFTVVLPKKYEIQGWNRLGGYWVGVRAGHGADQFYFQVTPEAASQKKFIWESETPDVAEYMDAFDNGIVPKKPGHAIFTVYPEGNPELKKKVELDFVYKYPLESITLEDEDTIYLKSGNATELNLKPVPANATDARMTWSYDKSGIVNASSGMDWEIGNFNSGEWATHSISSTRGSEGVVEVTGTPIDQTNSPESVKFTVVVAKDIETDKGIAKDFDASVLALSEKTNPSEDEVKALRAQYDKMTEVQKYLVKELAKLEEMEGTESAPIVNKKALEDALAKANKLVQADATSKDGKDVWKGKTWVTPEVQKSFDRALANAEKLYLQDNPKQADVDEAVKALESAISSYKLHEGTKDNSNPEKLNKPETPKKSDTSKETEKKQDNKKNPLKLEDKKSEQSEQTKKDNKTEDKVMFNDIQGHWAKDVIEAVVKAGYFKGTGPNTFSPNKATTRAQFVTVLGRIAKINPDMYTSSNFTDLQPNSYYEGYVNWANQEGFVKGVGGGKFDPNREITREEMATMLARYLEKQGKVSGGTRAVSYADSSEISSWAAQSVEQMTKLGLLQGKGENKFVPKGQTTRAELAQVIYNLELK